MRREETCENISVHTPTHHTTITSRNEVGTWLTMCDRSCWGRLMADAWLMMAPQKLHLTEQDLILPVRYLITRVDPCTNQRRRAASAWREAAMIGADVWVVWLDM